MSTQSFSPQVRQAIWKAHGCKCLYCTEPLLFINLFIDHVIPEVTTRDELQAIIERVGLRAGFDIYNWENHAPSCYRCNKNKLAHPFHDGYLSITLRKVEAKLPKVRELVQKAQDDWELDKVVRTIAHGVESGKYTHEDLVKSLEIVRRFPHGISGAGRPSPPASPEERIMGIKFSGRPITVRMPPSVKKRLKSLNITNAQLARQIETSVITGRFNIQALPRPTGGELQAYLIRMDQATRIRVELSEDTLDIKEVHNYHD
ncbi:HNH endonuclease [Sinorhizobium meliloti]|uniref:HNH endonuclease n=1 Tax=Rhizobium meliloti TaxID=382 RepID=UPI000FD290C7|nr:HNH endonuclease signature motif containing protein [Sinorhizobium meliloti]RVO43468.1 HNH endonuclease [Sinorhizobium meliloti]